MPLLDPPHCYEVCYAPGTIACSPGSLVLGPLPTALVGALGLSSYRLERFLDGAELREHEFNSVAEWCGGKPRPHVFPYLVAIGCFATGPRPRS